jgi:hypothetical protein
VPRDGETNFERRVHRFAFSMSRSLKVGGQSKDASDQGPASNSRSVSDIYNKSKELWSRRDFA